MTKVFIAGSCQLSLLNADVKRRIDRATGPQSVLERHGVRARFTEMKHQQLVAAQEWAKQGKKGDEAHKTP